MSTVQNVRLRHTGRDTIAGNQLFGESTMVEIGDLDGESILEELETKEFRVTDRIKEVMRSPLFLVSPDRLFVRIIEVNLQLMRAIYAGDVIESLTRLKVAPCTVEMAAKLTIENRDVMRGRHNMLVCLPSRLLRTLTIEDGRITILPTHSFNQKFLLHGTASGYSEYHNKFTL